jgi:hypothetical protein
MPRNQLRDGRRCKSFSAMAVAFSVAAIAAAWMLLLLGVEPVPTWFYVFVWYPTLVLLDRAATKLDGRPPLLRFTGPVLSLFLWSPVIWLVFEAANFRLRNWYYVFLPSAPVERWTGILLSFATVGPALFLAARLLEAAGVGLRWRTRPLDSRPWHLHSAIVLGLVMAALALGFPRVFFPLIWGAAWLIADPFVYGRRREWSLLADIERGQWGRIGRLLLGGLFIGLLWEGYNFVARGKWIYTVPWLEHTKLFEMPPLGFLGFPLLALEVWAIYHALCVSGVAAAPDEQAPRRQVIAAALPAALFTVAVLLGMERWTISSTTPHLRDIPGVDAARADRLAAAGLDSPFRLAASAAPDVAQHAAIDGAAADSIVESASLIVLRGIGTRHAARLNAAGVRTVCGLASHEPVPLWRSLWARTHATTAAGWLPPPGRPTPAEVRVWVGAARRDCAARSLVSDNP